MKNIFKFMGIALMAGSLMVACNPEENEPTDSTPSTPTDTTPVTPPAPQSTLTINWDGAAAQVGIVDAYQLQADFTVYILNAAAGLENDNYVFPIYRLGLDLDNDPSYGCAIAALYRYTFGGGQYEGGSLFPTDVVESAYYTSSVSQNMGILGDWWLDQYTVQPDLTLANAQFDATNLTLTTSFSLQMFSFSDYNDAGLGQDASSEEVMAALQAADKANLEVSMTNYKFDAATGKGNLNVKRI